MSQLHYRVMLRLNEFICFNLFVQCLAQSKCLVNVCCHAGGDGGEGAGTKGEVEVVTTCG